MRPGSHDTSTQNSAKKQFEEIADELYGLVPQEFTAARAHYEKEARQAGEKELAMRVHTLTKPSAAAWLANQLAREQHEELLAVPELGDRLRGATADLAGEELRQLSRQQHELVQALLQHAEELARVKGRAVSETAARGLEDTLYAALADKNVAEQLLGGRLTDAVRHSGFGEGTAPAAAGNSPERSMPIRRPRAGRQRATHQPDRELVEAEHTLRAATTVRNQLLADLAHTDEVVKGAQEKLERMQRELEEAHAAANEAARERRDQAKALQRAERAVADAERRRTEAQRLLGRQSGGK